MPFRGLNFVHGPVMGIYRSRANSSNTFKDEQYLENFHLKAKTGRAGQYLIQGHAEPKFRLVDITSLYSGPNLGQNRFLC